MSEPSYYTREGAPIRCDCEPARPAVLEYDVAAWGPKLPPDVRAAIDDQGPSRLLYVAHCAEYPRGCGWIEATLRAGSSDGE